MSKVLITHYSKDPLPVGILQQIFDAAGFRPNPFGITEKLVITFQDGSPLIIEQHITSDDEIVDAA